MFWGLIMEPNKRYTQTVEKAFHLSMASLDAATASGGLVQVMICYDNRNYLLCTLQKGSIWQVPLDLNFQEGTKIAFTCNGDGHVHLTGYLVPEEEIDDDIDDFEEDEELEEDDEVPVLVGPKKRKALASPKEKNDPKRAKKSKVEEDEDDDESDSDNYDGIDFRDDSDDDLDGEEEDDDDEDEDDDDSDDDAEEEEEVPVKLSKKQLKQQQKQNQQNQQNHQQNQNQQQGKKGKDKLVNGKDAKPEKEQGKQKKNKENSKTEDKPEPQKRRTIEGGVQIEDIKVGEGAPAKSGKFVSVYYIGRLKNGKKFDHTQQGEGFKFRLGKGEVIKGWDVGITGMKVGGKRRITIPPNMAYGAKGSPPVIPPNSQLNFEVELRAIH